jgi:hypothetical protein
LVIPASVAYRDSTAPSVLHQPMGRTPDWWKPSDLRQVQRLDGFHRGEQGGYIWYFSKSEPTIYFFWCRT